MSDPDAQLLERFNPLDVAFQLTAAPEHGDLTVAGQTSPVAAGTACALSASALPCPLAYQEVSGMLQVQHCMGRG